MKSQKLKKLKTNLRKTVTRNKSSKSSKMTGGTRKSTRGKPITWIPSLTLGTGSPANFQTYNKQLLTKKDIKDFVEKKIKEGYQQVAMPMPPDESHSIIVHVVEVDGEKSIVKIVDWGGKKNKTRKEPKTDPTINGGKKFDKWFNYTTFIKCLEENYKVKVEYVEINHEEDIYKNAICRYERGRGGCSEYLDGWVKQNLTDNGKVAVLLAVNGQENWK